MALQLNYFPLLNFFSQPSDKNLPNGVFGVVVGDGHRRNKYTYLLFIE